MTSATPTASKTSSSLNPSHSDSDTNNNHSLEAEISAHATRFQGTLPLLYHKVRPTPPVCLLSILTTYCQNNKHINLNNNPNWKPRIADIGCGTGLSSVYWKDYSSSLIGVEPSNDMRLIANNEYNTIPGFSFIQGNSSNTNIPSESIDIVQFSQSLHWCEPESTFKEVYRILSNGGIMVSIDCDWPPIIADIDIESKYIQIELKASELAKEKGWTDHVRKYNKDGHEQRLKNSGLFKYVKEIVLHNQIQNLTIDHFVSILRSQGIFNTLAQNGYTDEMSGITQFANELKTRFGDQTMTFLFSYRVRIAFKHYTSNE